MKIRLKRTYEEAEKADGYRVLADRLWPRGIKKEHLATDLWAKEIAPSTNLRKSYHSGEISYDEFSKAYEQELRNNPDFDAFLKTIEVQHTVTLLTSAKIIEVSALPTLERFLEEKQ